LGRENPDQEIIISLDLKIIIYLDLKASGGFVFSGFYPINFACIYGHSPMDCIEAFTNNSGASPTQGKTRDITIPRGIV